jgi:hypothetical protein
MSFSKTFAATYPRLYPQIIVDAAVIVTKASSRAKVALKYTDLHEGHSTTLNKIYSIVDERRATLKHG